MLVGLAGSAWSAESAVGRKVDPFMLKVFRGKEHSLNDVLAQHKDVRSSFGDRMPAGQTLCGRHAGTVAGVREEGGRPDRLRLKPAGCDHRDRRLRAD
jgi:hypothetical protein